MSDQETDWRNDIAEFHDKLKFGDGETKTLKFLDEGHVFTGQYSPAVVFEVECAGEKYSWFVNQKTVGLLASIKKLGTPLRGKIANVRRDGLDIKTRWTLEAEGLNAPAFSDTHPMASKEMTLVEKAIEQKKLLRD